MNREDIIELAREADIDWHQHWVIGEDENRLERFAALVAAAEREACALVLDKVIEHLYIYNYDGDASTELRKCAKAIRERSEA